jgi:hypothetical protein
MKINILGRTGPRSIKGKANSSMNALKHGGYSQREVLHFEDATERKRLERQLYRALKPRDSLEETLVDQMIQSLWLAERFKLRLSLRQDSIFQELTSSVIAELLCIPEPYRSHPPDFLKEPNTKFNKKEVGIAAQRFTAYQHLCKNSKGISNYQMVFGAYQDLFDGLHVYLGNRFNVPILASTGQGISIAWQQQSKKMEEVLEEYASYLYYQIHFETLRPQIRVWMSSWFFLQRRDQRDHDFQDEQVIKELNRYQATLTQLLKYRKVQFEGSDKRLDSEADQGNEMPNLDSKSMT